MGSNKSDGNTIDRDVFGRKFRKLRKIKGWTQRELAEMLGYATEAMISHIETGKSYMDQDMIYKAAELFGVNPAVMMGGEDYSDGDLKMIVNLMQLIRDEDNPPLETVRALLDLATKK